MTLPAATLEETLARVYATADIGDEVEQHEYTCSLADNCGCEVIVYRLATDGWHVVDDA